MKISRPCWPLPPQNCRKNPRLSSISLGLKNLRTQFLVVSTPGGRLWQSYWPTVNEWNSCTLILSRGCEHTSRLIAGRYQLWSNWFVSICLPANLLTCYELGLTFESANVFGDSCRSCWTSPACNCQAIGVPWLVGFNPQPIWKICI